MPSACPPVSQIMKALILAAGFGTRLSPYTDITPKPLFEVNEKPILAITIEKLIQAGCSAIIINTHHLHEQIEAFIAQNTYPIPVETRYEAEILDTGGAIKNVQDFLGKAPFFVINSDIVTDIDYKKVFDFHQSHPHPATLVVHDYPEFNKVSVDTNGLVQGFHLKNCSLKKLAFTGIQVLDPVVFDDIPAGKFTSSIELYKKLIKKSNGVSGFITNDYWIDIGTPEKFSMACIDAAAHKAFNTETIIKPEIKKLKGDGSDRKWYRLEWNTNTLVLGDHGISNDRSLVNEVESFIGIGKHLKKAGLPVPEIYHTELFPGHVYLEDLGDRDLEQTINKATSEADILFHYKKILGLLVRLSVDGGKNFNTSLTCQSPRYDKNIIIENECLYFINAFVNPVAKITTDPITLLEEFSTLADCALASGYDGFMHRDFQSKNIMVKESGFYFIDFQSGRLGPVQYDLASIIIDPYVALPESLQEHLVDYFLDEYEKVMTIDRESFLKSYIYLKITRNLQMLGAFGFLSRVKGKSWFEAYIPTAVATLKSNIKKTNAELFPKLRKLIETI